MVYVPFATETRETPIIIIIQQSRATFVMTALNHCSSSVTLNKLTPTDR